MRFDPGCYFHLQELYIGRVISVLKQGVAYLMQKCVGAFFGA
jgi:hypothetical protein